MKSVLQNLLIVLALGLCGLCGVQWLREAGLRKELEKDRMTLVEKDAALRSLEAARKRLEADLLALDGRNASLREIARTNDEDLALLRVSLSKTENDLKAARSRIDEYQRANVQANANVEKNNTTIREQNKLLQDVAGQRDDFLKKLNETTRQYNELVGKYNALVKQIEQAQAVDKKEP
jgi:chromosome segregation ATPase